MRLSLPVAEIVSAAHDARLVSAVDTMYADLDARIEARQPLCVNRGDCCKFGQFGHRLFVTPVEVAYFLARTDGAKRPADASGACPYQRGGRCTAREARPLGCRVFYCESASRSWQPGETEDTLQRIKELHGRFHLRYAYVEWLSALREVHAAGEPAVDGAE